MISKLLNKWKNEWWEKRESKLIEEFSIQEKSLKEDLQEHITKDKESFEAAQKENRNLSLRLEFESARLRAHEIEISEAEKSLIHKKALLEEESKNLSEQLRLLEAKAHPSSVWTEAFTCGFNHAWNTMQPIIFENLERSKKLIHDLAVEETLRNNPQWRTNGNHKTTH